MSAPQYYLVEEVILYRVKATSATEAEAIITASEDRDKYFVECTSPDAWLDGDQEDYK